jgi:hypothetical protein
LFSVHCLHNVVKKEEEDKDSLSMIVFKFVRLIQMFMDEYPVSDITQILALFTTAHYPQ